MIRKCSVCGEMESASPAFAGTHRYGPVSHGPFVAARPILSIRPNGDPYGSGFVGSESHDGGATWFYRGDIGAAPRWRWRSIARRMGAILRYGD